MPKDGLTTISTIGLGLTDVSSLMRIPNPPASMTAFNAKQVRSLRLREMKPMVKPIGCGGVKAGGNNTLQN